MLYETLGFERNGEMIENYYCKGRGALRMILRHPQDKK